MYRVAAWALVPVLACTFSRAGWAALILVLFGLFLSGRRAIAKARAVFGVALFVGILVASGAAVLRMDDLLSQNRSIPEVVIGRGLDTVILDNTAQESYRAHNTYLAFYHDTGLLGLAGLLGLFGSLLAAGVRQSRSAPINSPGKSLFLTCTLTMIILSCTEEPIMTPVVAFTYYVVLIVATALARPYSLAAGPLWEFGIRPSTIEGHRDAAELAHRF